MTYDYLGKANKADEKIAYYGAPALLRHVTGKGTFNETTGRTEPTFSEHRIFAIEKSVKITKEDGKTKTFAEVQVGPAAPAAVDDRLTWNNQEFRIVAVKPFIRGGVLIYQFLEIES